jgi:hypothetical protein
MTAAVFPPSSSANTPAKKRSGTGKVLPDPGTGLQPFFPDPSAPGAWKMYRADLMPISDPSAPEMLDFGCSFPGGYANTALIGTSLSTNEQRLLRKNVGIVRDRYSKPSDGLSATASMQASLLKQQHDLRANDGEDGAAVAALFDPAIKGGASSPADVTATIPAGCPLDQFNNFPSVGKGFGSLTTLLSNPGGWIVNTLMLGTIGDITKAAYDYVQPSAFSYTFYTPHSERGDTIFSVPTSCDSGANTDTCNKGQVLGFSVSKNKRGVAPPFWIRISMFFQWLISLTYFLIIACAAVLYMFRGHHAETAQRVMTLLPRLLISIVLTVFSSWLIGVMITLSNLLVRLMFTDQNTARGINEVFLAFGNSGGGELTGTFWGVVQIGVLTVANFFLFFFYLAALFRQLALLILIVIVPIAIASMLFDRTRDHFSKYWTILTTLIFTPVVLGLVLKVGLALNPSITSGEKGHGGGAIGLVGAMMLLITFWVMLRVLTGAKSVITGKQSSGIMTRLGKTTKLAGKAYGMVDPVTGAAIAGAGGAMQAGGEKADQAAGTLIPSSRMRALSTRRSKQVGGRSLATQAGGAGGTGTGLATSTGFKDAALGKVLGAGGASSSKSAKRAAALSVVLGGNARVEKQFDLFIHRDMTEQGMHELTKPEHARAVQRGEKALSRARHDATTGLAEATAQGLDEKATREKLGDHARFVRFDADGNGAFDEDEFKRTWAARNGTLQERGGRHYVTYRKAADPVTSADPDLGAVAGNVRSGAVPARAPRGSAPRHAQPTPAVPAVVKATRKRTKGPESPANQRLSADTSTTPARTPEQTTRDGNVSTGESSRRGKRGRYSFE